MAHYVTIAYPQAESTPIRVDYSVDLSENIHTINCALADSRVPVWLQLRKFCFSSSKKSGGYVQMFTEVNYSKNMDTSLFLDLVYSSIMSAERLKMFDPLSKN